MKRTPARILMSLAAGVAVTATASGALAQSDLEFAPTDVMLLVDTSGSMALTSVRDPANPTRFALPECGAYPNTRPVDLNTNALGGSSSPPDRWTMLVNTLTGTVNGLECAAQPRTTPDFRAEYGLGGDDPSTTNLSPYDADYYLPFNRIVSAQGGSKCTPAPSWDNSIRTQLRDNAIMWPTNGTGGPVYWRDLAGNIDPGTVCGFEAQDEDGLIDRFKQIVRFGLMTFDPLPSRMVGTTKYVGTGIITGSNPPQANYATGVPDTWSYFPNWMTDASANNSATGWPGGCNEQNNSLIEVGARNPAAPPWEGRLIDFGDPMAGAEEIAKNNERVERALMAIRPYGATPIAGLLQDASHFLLEDDTYLVDASNRPYFWGGTKDPGVDHTPGEGCRKRVVILLTDGGPNLDLRPDCGFDINGIPGKCPYRLPEESAELLANNNVPVYVIGFSVTASTGGSTSTCTDLLAQAGDPCSTLASCTATSCGTGQCAYGYCLSSAADETLAACCTMKGIANKGGTDPFFAEDYGELKAAFAKILVQENQHTLTRTQPVFATGNANLSITPGPDEPLPDFMAAAKFLTSYDPIPGDLYAGKLERERYTCEPDGTTGAIKVELADVEGPLGDQFQTNTDSSLAKRIVYTVVPEVISNEMTPERSIRPLYVDTSGDGLGKIGVDPGSSDADSHMVSAEASAITTAIDPRAVVKFATTCDVSTSLCCFKTPAQPNPTPEICRTRFLQMQLGFDVSGNSDITFKRSSAFGAVMYAVPVLVTRPQDFLRDGSYTKFMTILKDRPAVIYAPTVDGQLHAFLAKQPVKKIELNELWTFMPPAVLPRIQEQFTERANASHSTLLDGPITVREVAGQVAQDPKNRFLKRTRSDILDTSVDRTRWYTVLVGSFGSSRGYYALDVTWPESKKDPPLNSGYVKGPRFLWQLTTDADGQPLFGQRSAPPTITTLFFTMPGDSGPAEHAVAILPGGYGGERTTTEVDVTFNTTDNAVDSRFPPRTTTADYVPVGASASDARTLGGARSLTVVRLDTGEVVRTFRRGAANSVPVVGDLLAPAGLYGTSPLRITPAPFDAPIMGHVVAFPAGPGAVADRAFVGDAEGRLWRVDLTSVDPSDWGVELYHDAFPTDGPGSMGYTWEDAAPIETPPILSTDPLGRLTIALSTGTQQSITKHGTFPVWSLTESRNAGAVEARVNWYLNGVNSPSNTKTGTPHFNTGERVTGPMALFDGGLYFTTYDPSLENSLTCDPGDSFLWGVHYINAGPNHESHDLDNPNLGPAPWLNLNPPDDDPNALPQAEDWARIQDDFAPGTVAFGVGVVQKPSCYTIEAASDQYLGNGVSSEVSNITAAQFQLIVQTGRTGDSANTAETKTTKHNLNPLLVPGKIDSWATVLD